MKTIKEHLAEADRKQLLDAMAYHFLEDPLHLLELKNLAVSEIMERYRRYMDDFIGRLLETEAERNPEMVLYLYSDYENDDVLDLIRIAEVSSDIEGPGHDISFSDWSSSLGYFVADTKQTQDHLNALLAQYLSEAGFFGTELNIREKKLKEVTEVLDEAIRNMHEEAAKPADGLFDEIRREHGFPVPEKDPEQEKLKERIYSAIAEYSLYSRSRERRRILASIVS